MIIAVASRVVDPECRLTDSDERRVYAYAQVCSDAVVIRAPERSDLPVFEFREVGVIDAPVAPGYLDPARVLVTLR